MATTLFPFSIQAGTVKKYRNEGYAAASLSRLSRNKNRARMPLGIAALVFLCLALIPGAGRAATITYTGTDPNGNILVNISGWQDNLEGGLKSLVIAEPADNTISVSYTPAAGMTNPDFILGGYNAEALTVTNNTVILNQGAVTFDVFGGYAFDGDATGNAVHILEGTVARDIHGAYSFTGDASANFVHVRGEVNGHVHGGVSMAGNANNNVVIVDGTVLNRVFAGQVAGDVIDATITASDNTVIVNESGQAETVVGGLSKGQAGAVNNTVIINGGIVTGDDEESYVSGGETAEGRAAGNTVFLNAGTTLGDVHGARSSAGDAQGNTAFFTNGTVGRSIYGALAFGNATDNAVYLNGAGTVMADVLGGSSEFGLGDTDRNLVVLNGNTVTGSIYGGLSASGNAVGNTVELISGKVGGNVYGGYVLDGVGNATGNTVTLSSGIDLSRVGLFGGESDVLEPTGNMLSGNTLNINRFQGSIREIKNFENYNFLLPSRVRPGQALVTITGSNAVELQGRSVNVAGNLGGQALPPGSRLSLFTLASGTPADLTVNVTQGISLRYSFTMLPSLDQLILQVSGVQVNPQTKALAEGRIAGLAFVNQGADLVAGPGLSNAAAAAPGAGGLGAFAATSGGTSRYNTGSHVDVDGFSVMGGLAWRSPSDSLFSNALLLGVFFEAGWGNYDSSNSFTSLPSIQGEGDTKYYGGGILARYYTELGLYGDASARMGKTETDFSSGDLRDLTGAGASYDSSAMYYSAHIGLGYTVPVTEKGILDINTKYLWTKVEGDSVNVLGDPITFASANSHRWRTGGRFSYSVTDLVTPFAGAYYEHEFDGKAKAAAYGYSIDAPDLEGGTGIGELGIRFTPSAEIPISLSLGVQGYTGTREGVTGNATFQWEF